MALKDRFRRAVSAARKDSLSTASSSPPSSAPSSGTTSPVLSRTPSDVQLPALIQATTNLTISDSSLKLTKSSSGFSKLSRFRSSKSEFEKHAPKNFKFQTADPAKVATLGAWDWSYGSTRGSISGSVCPLTP